MESGYATMKEFLKSQKPFTAAVCNGASLCMGVVKALKESNLSIPEDISMVGLGDDISELTTVAFDLEEVGRTAVKRLIEKITSSNWQPGRILIQNKLIIRSSTRKIVLSKIT